MSVPEGWTKSTLGDRSKLVTSGSRGWAKFYADEGSPFYRITNLRRSSITPDVTELKRVKLPPKVQKKHRTKLQAGDLLISITAELGVIGFIKSAPVQDSYINQHVALVRPETTDTDPSFLAYLLASEPYRRRFWRMNDSGAKAGLNLPSVRSIGLTLPPLPEQRRIAEILGTWDRAIAVQEALIRTAEAQKTALMQQLLTPTRRLPGFTDEWEVVRLGDLGKISSAGVDKKVVDGETPVRLLNFTDVFSREVIFDADLDHEVSAPDSKVRKCNVLAGDVFFTPTSETPDDIGISAVAGEDMPGVTYSYHVVRLRPNRRLDPAYARYAFTIDGFRRQAVRVAQGSGQRYVISQDMLRDMTILVPTVEEQRAIGAAMNSVSDYIDQLKADLTHLRAEKTALMQQLLTGKRRVRVEEAA